MSELLVTSKRTFAFPRGIVTALREHALLALIIALYALSTVVIATTQGAGVNLSFSLYSATVAVALVTSGIIIFLGFILYMPIVEREPRPLRRMYRILRDYLTSPYRVTATVATVLLLPFFLSSFTSFKTMISAVHPFRFDELFMQLDRTLHFGIDPWHLTHAVFGSLSGTLALNFVYVIWFVFMWGFVLWYTFAWRIPAERMRFLIAFMLCWILVGSFGALALSSAGPAYYGAITGLEDPYAPLMAKLNAMRDSLDPDGFWNIWALGVQEKLWAKYTAAELGAGTGISAMPSMHVSIAMLLALAGWQRHRLLGWLMTAHVVLIQVGSVHLGWHYAIDGYLAILMTFGIWVWSDRLARRAVQFSRAGS